MLKVEPWYEHVFLNLHANKDLKIISTSLKPHQTQSVIFPCCFLRLQQLSHESHARPWKLAQSENAIVPLYGKTPVMNQGAQLHRKGRRRTQMMFHVPHFWGFIIKYKIMKIMVMIKR